MYFVLYKDRVFRWRWTLYAENNRKVADSGEGYWKKIDAQHDIALVIGTSANTPVYER